MFNEPTVDLHVSEAPIEPIEALNLIRSPECGAIEMFCGTVRDHDRRSKLEPLERIKGLNYEIYKKMLAVQLDRTFNKFFLEDSNNEPKDMNARVLVRMRSGFVPIGEISILICVSATHSSLAREAVGAVLRYIKNEAPIWKKKIFENGDEIWS